MDDPERIRGGAGNYSVMCTGCHLAPGMAETELSKGLNPAPPNLSKEPVDAAEAFWVIKHGIKASGMPAWGMSMKDEYIWGMVAFLQQLPKLSATQYQEMVASSGGHSHGGGETTPQGPGQSAGAAGHPPGTPPNHHRSPSTTPAAPTPETTPQGPSQPGVPDGHPPGTPPNHHGTPSTTPSAPAPKTTQHRHADGTVESHPTPQATPVDASNHR